MMDRYYDGTLGIMMVLYIRRTGGEAYPRGMRKLDEDLKNCFCEIDRTGMIEDLLHLCEVLGQDFGDVLRYVHMVYQVYQPPM